MEDFLVRTCRYCRAAVPLAGHTSAEHVAVERSESNGALAAPEAPVSRSQSAGERASHAEVAAAESLLHCQGIWLHAQLYGSRRAGWKFESELPEWARGFL
jgi:hypothetical protein